MEYLRPSEVVESVNGYTLTITEYGKEVVAPVERVTFNSNQKKKEEQYIEEQLEALPDRMVYAYVYQNGNAAIVLNPQVFQPTAGIYISPQKEEAFKLNQQGKYFLIPSSTNPEIRSLRFIGLDHVFNVIAIIDFQFNPSLVQTNKKKSSHPQGM